jgi:hypothetical protein
VLPNKHSERSHQAFEKLRKEELSGKAKGYHLLFLENKFLKDIYHQNIQAAKKLMLSFKRNVFHTYQRLQ